MLRWSRITFVTTFLAVQKSTDYSELYRRGVLEEDSLEDRWIRATPIGQVPLMTMGWMQAAVSKHLQKTPTKGTESLPAILLFQETILKVRGGIGGTLAYCNTPPPFMYSHLVYWVVQLLLVFIAIITGFYLAVMWKRRKNGDSAYSYDDDIREWPRNDINWYCFIWLIRVASNALFTLFIQGLLAVCASIENPCGGGVHCLPEYFYDIIMYNNCRYLHQHL